MTFKTAPAFRSAARDDRVKRFVHIDRALHSSVTVSDSARAGLLERQGLVVDAWLREQLHALGTSSTGQAFSQVQQIIAEAGLDSADPARDGTINAHSLQKANLESHERKIEALEDPYGVGNGSNFQWRSWLPACISRRAVQPQRRQEFP